MDKLMWSAPTIDELKNFKTLPFKGSDTSWINIYLLRRKYKTEIAVKDGVLFRYYHGKTPNRQGYGFPLSVKEPDHEKVFDLLKEDAKDRGELKFCLCDEGQKEILLKYFDLEWQSEIGDNDYIYEGEKWIAFSGRKYNHLRNRMNGFNRRYEDVTYYPIDSEKRLQDAMHVAMVWQDEHVNEEMPSDEHKEELDCITEVADHWQEMGMTGGVLYVKDSPVAMTMASFLSTDSVDFHFDKAVGEYAAVGATVVSRRRFAMDDIAKGRPYFNLEEDMNIPGLRQSKETYRPAFKYAKYYGGGSLC